MNLRAVYITLGVTFVVIIIMALVSVSSRDESPYGTDELSTFATCIADSGAVFYGAFWCSHCQNQKRAFGDAVDIVPYVECSTPDGRGQTAVCRDAGITSYPTWVFSDGTSVSGEIPFADLAEYTNCPAPDLAE